MNSVQTRLSWFVAVGTVLYFVFLTATVPAAWVGELLSRTTHGKARLLGAQGSLWNGSGTLVFSPAGGMALQNRLHWTANPLWLVTGRLRADIRSSGDLAFQSTVTVGYQHVHVKDLSGEFAASHAQAFYPPAMLVSPTGQFKVSGNNISLGKAGFAGELRLTWAGAGSKLGAAGELGDYLVIANGQNGDATLRVETLRGDVRIDARGIWQAHTDGSLILDGTLAPGQREASLAAMLAALNARKNGDRYPLKLNTRVPLPPFLGGPG